MLILYDPKDFDQVLTLFFSFMNPVQIKNSLISFQVYRSEEPIPSRPGFDTLNYYRKNLEKSKYEGIHSLTTSYVL